MMATRADPARVYCAVDEASVPVVCSGGGLSLAANGSVAAAAGEMSFAGSATSGVEDAVDVIGTTPDAVVVLVLPVTSARADVGWPAGAPTKST